MNKISSHEATKPQSLPQLQLCPFCGEQPSLIKSKVAKNLYSILCPDHSPCIGSGLVTCALGENLETAVAQFNRRVFVSSCESPK